MGFRSSASESEPVYITVLAEEVDAEASSAAFRTVVLNLGSIEPSGFSQSVSVVRRRLLEVTCLVFHLL